jgi:hypothetical protein
MVRCYIRSFLLVLIRSAQERLKICYVFAFLGTVSYLCFCVSASVFRSRYRHRRVRIRRRGVLQRKNLADPALRNIILTFACFFNQCFVFLLLTKMFMNVEVEKKILQFQGAGSGRVFSLKKQLVSRSARLGIRRRQLTTSTDTFCLLLFAKRNLIRIRIRILYFSFAYESYGSR